MAISVNLIVLIGNVILLVLNLLSYRANLPRYIRYKFRKEPEEFFARFRNTGVVMLIVSVLCLFEFSFHGTLFSLLEHHIDGDPISFERFLYRSALFFSLISSLLVYGLQIILSMTLSVRS